MEIKHNIGTTDRYIRALVGLAFLMNIIALEPGRLGTFIFLALGLVLLVTAFTRYCPLYEPFKINTIEQLRKPEEPKEQASSH